MRLLKMITLLSVVCAVSCGCSVSREVENQAYVLTMGVDIAPDSGLELTVRIPKVGQSDPDTDGKAASPYLVFSASGGDFPEALEDLQSRVPRELNLSHLKLLVVSESLAASDAFPSTINRIAETPHLYTAARFVVCEGPASAFVKAQKTVIGKRLSTEIDAEFDHLALHGRIPDARFADAYFAGNSIYGDPVAIWGCTEPKSEDEAVGPAADSEPEDRYAGAAVLKDGRLVERLNAEETLLLNLIRGRREAFSYPSGGKSCTLTQARKPRISVGIRNDVVQIRVDIALATVDTLSSGTALRIAGDIEADIAALVRRCQQLRIEPFGFAERAATRFLTVDDWLAWNWRERFSSADVDVCVTLPATGA